MIPYVRQIEDALGIGEPGKTRLEFQPFDMGQNMGVAFTLVDGKRFALKAVFAPGWEQDIIAGAREMMGLPA